MIASNESTSDTIINVTQEAKLVEVKSIEMPETLYQPIWNMTTEGSPDNNNNSTQTENIYVSLDFAEAEDDWEPAESEFAFTNSMDEIEKMLRENEQKKIEALKSFDDPYKTICILFNDKSPELNHIVYEYNRDKLLTYEITEMHTTLTESNKTYDINEQQIGDIPECVKAWKKSMLMMDYLDEEEDVVSRIAFIYLLAFCASGFGIVFLQFNVLKHQTFYFRL